MLWGELLVKSDEVVGGFAHGSLRLVCIYLLGGWDKLRWLL